VHSHQSQIIAIEQMRAGGRIISERALREQSTSGAIPDFVLRKQGGDEWHEVELSPKYAERLFFQLQERNRALKTGRFLKLIWWCGRPGIARNLMAALSLKVIPQVMRRADGRIVKVQGEEGWSPAKLREASEILLTNGKRGTQQAFQNGQLLLEESREALLQRVADDL
jgi:hypothetical protein